MMFKKYLKLFALIAAVIPATINAQAAKLYIEDFSINPGETKTIDIIMENPDIQVWQAQLDVRLPEGLSVTKDDGNMLVWPMRGLGRIVASFGKANVAAKRIGEIFDMDSEFNINGDKKPEITGDIEFENVSFKFEDTNSSLLNDISFKIKSGQTVALVGKTGSGKSTICNILVRFP